MAVTNLYSNLPGHLVEFKDGGLQLTSTQTDTSSTKSLLILGTATDGPINEPVKIDAVTVSQVFGKEVNAEGYPNGATLTKYAKQAFKNGFDDVRCMRVTGSQAYTTIYGQQTTGYLDVSDVVDGADATDGNGAITGNAEFSYNFTDSSHNDRCFVSASGGDGQYFILDKGDGSSVQQIGLSNDQGLSWNRYQGFTINANTFSEIETLAIHCKGIIFIGNTLTNTDGDFANDIAKKQVSTATVSATDSVFDPINIAIPSTPDIDTKFFTTTKNNSISKMPQIEPGELDENGFKVTGIDSNNDPILLTYGEDYTAEIKTVDDNLVYQIVPQDGGRLTEGANIEVTFYPYNEVDIDKTFTNDFNETVSNSTIDISEAMSKEEAQVTSVTIGSTIYAAANADFADKFSINNGILTVTNQKGMNVGDTIKVAYSYKKPITSDLELKVKSQFGGSLYKDGTVEVKKIIDGTNQYTIVEFTKPAAKTTTQATKTYSYSSKYYQTIDDLILAMKNDMNNLNMFEIEIVKGEGSDPIDLLTAIPAKALDQGGEDGLKPSNNDMFKALSGERYTIADIGSPVSSYSSEIVTQDMVGYLKTQGAYQILENYNVDYIYPAGVYADSVQTVDPNSDFQRELALVCAVLTYRTKMTHGFIDVKPNSNTTLVGIDAYVAKLINGHPNIYYMTDQNGDIIYDSENKPMDIGWYTSVVVGPEVVMTSDTLGTYYGSPAIAYAALNSVLEPQSSPLNKALRNVNGMKFKFSNKQMDAIVGNRMVCFKLKNEGLATASSTPYVVEGITSGAPNCDYSDIVTVKVITDVVDNIRQVADPFLGENNTTEQRNALSALISKRLSKLVELGEIQRYEFEVSATIQQQLLGEASIALTIVPANTLKRITTVVSLRAAE